MDKTLKTLEETLATVNHPFLHYSLPPLKKEELVELFINEGMALIDDLIDLYLWKDGLTVDMICSEKYVEFSSFGCLVECRSSLDWYTRKLINEPEIRGKLPFVSMDSGEYLAIDLDSRSDTLGQIFLYSPSVTVGMKMSDGMVPIYSSVKSYLSSVIECYRMGAYKLSGNILDVDYDLEAAISGKLNPDIDLWKDPEPQADTPEVSTSIRVYNDIIATQSSDIKNALERLEETLAAINHPFLMTGTTPVSIDEIVRDFHKYGVEPDSSLLALYLWNSGVFSDFRYNDSYRDLCSCGGLVNHWTAVGLLITDRLTEDKLNNKVPVILSKSQCYLAMDLGKQSRTFGQLFVSSERRGSEIVSIYDTLKSFIDTITDCYRSGAYVLSDTGLDIDWQLEAKISRDHNPRSDYWKNVERYSHLIRVPVSTSLMDLERVLSDVDHPFLRACEPAETKQDITNLLNELNLVAYDDLISLYLWKGGIGDPSVYRECYPELCSCGNIIDLRSAAMQLRSNRLSERSSTDMLPFILTKSGHYIAVDLGKQSKTFGRLFLLTAGADKLKAISIYDSLKDFLNSIAEAYQFKSYKLSGDRLVIDCDIETAISRKHNPHSDYWKNVDKYKYLTEP